MIPVKSKVVVTGSDVKVGVGLGGIDVGVGVDNGRGVAVTGGRVGCTVAEGRISWVARTATGLAIWAGDAARLDWQATVMSKQPSSNQRVKRWEITIEEGIVYLVEIEYRGASLSVDG